jgi:hypothetical protein
MRQRQRGVGLGAQGRGAAASSCTTELCDGCSITGPDRGRSGGRREAGGQGGEVGCKWTTTDTTRPAEDAAAGATVMAAVEEVEPFLALEALRYSLPRAGGSVQPSHERRTKQQGTAKHARAALLTQPTHSSQSTNTLHSASNSNPQAANTNPLAPHLASQNLMPRAQQQLGTRVSCVRLPRALHVEGAPRRGREGGRQRHTWSGIHLALDSSSGVSCTMPSGTCALPRRRRRCTPAAASLAAKGCCSGLAPLLPCALSRLAASNPCPRPRHRRHLSPSHLSGSEPRSCRLRYSP